MRRICARQFLVVVAASLRNSATNSDADAAQAPSDPFDVLFNISTTDEFLEGAKQAHCAVGSVLARPAPGLTIPLGLVTNNFRNHVSSLALRELNPRRLMHADEHVLAGRIISITLEKRQSAIPEDDVGAPLPEWSSTYRQRLVEPIADAPPPEKVMEEEMPSRSEDQTLSEFLKPADPPSRAIQRRKAADLARRYRVCCSVELIVASPPERFYRPEEIHFYEHAVRDAHNAREKKACAKLLAVSSVYGFFRFWDSIMQRTVKTGLQLFLESMPLEMFSLPADYFSRPPAVKKTLRFELTPDLRWLLDVVAVDPAYLPVGETEMPDAGSRPPGSS